jgi:hypothetical protein
MEVHWSPGRAIDQLQLRTPLGAHAIVTIIIAFSVLRNRSEAGHSVAEEAPFVIAEESVDQPLGPLLCRARGVRDVQGVYLAGKRSEAEGIW